MTLIACLAILPRRQTKGTRLQSNASQFHRTAEEVSLTAIARRKGPRLLRTVGMRELMSAQTIRMAARGKWPSQPFSQQARSPIRDND
jgi:hypothetical protein